MLYFARSPEPCSQKTPATKVLDGYSVVISLFRGIIAGENAVPNGDVKTPALRLAQQLAGTSNLKRKT